MLQASLPEVLANPNSQGRHGEREPVLQYHQQKLIQPRRAQIRKADFELKACRKTIESYEAKINSVHSTRNSESLQYVDL